MIPYKIPKPRILCIDPDTDTIKFLRDNRDRNAFVKVAAPAVLDPQGLEVATKFIIYPDGPRVVVECECCVTDPEGSRDWFSDTITLTQDTWPAFKEMVLRSVKKVDWYLKV